MRATATILTNNNFSYLQIFSPSAESLTGTAYLPGQAKPPKLLNQWRGFIVHWDLECPMAVQHSKFSDWFNNIL